MNSQGWIRGLISSNSSMEQYVELVIKTISNEFGFKTSAMDNGDNYIFYIDNYEFYIKKDEVAILQKRSPYAIDKYILDSIRNMGFEFDFHRSQYIEYCYGLI